MHYRRQQIYILGFISSRNTVIIYWNVVLFSDNIAIIFYDLFFPDFDSQFPIDLQSTCYQLFVMSHFFKKTGSELTLLYLYLQPGIRLSLIFGWRIVEGRISPFWRSSVQEILHSFNAKLSLFWTTSPKIFFSRVF